jgi:hypothetical protein
VHKADRLAEMDVSMDLLMERSFKFKRGLWELIA